ncbi:MAG: hypothetical protein KDD82_28705 [Planctomycetes bacterium]|nr:hypothetical protein [Planctomycetota bacterium]
MDAGETGAAVVGGLAALAGLAKGLHTWLTRGGDGAPKAGELVEGIAKLRRENERLQREVDRLHAALDAERQDAAQARQDFLAEVDRLHAALDAERQDAAQARQDFLAEDRVRNADVQRLYQELLLRANTTGSSEESANGS